VSARRAALLTAVLLGASAIPLRPRAQNGGAPIATSSLAAVDAELHRLAAEQQRIAQESAALTPRAEALRQRAREQIRWLHHLAQGDALAAHGGPEMLLEHAARAARLRRVVDNTVNALRDSELRARAMADERVRVDGLLAAAQTQRAALARAQRPVVDPAVAPSPLVTVYGGAPVGTSAVDTFATSAGRLLFPVAGRAEVRRAWRDGADGPGVEISAPVGTPVRAVFGGRVAFADRYGSYGLIVIVDHGDHYYSVSASLGRAAVQVGQELDAGAVLGFVGDESGRAGLFFEVRHQGATLDPVPWLGL
jgi:septal ring factor EnvC (AmiA/AmiB activator)